MVKFKVTTLTNQELTVEADLYRESDNGQWVDFIRKGTGSDSDDHEQVLRLRAQNVAEIERLED